MVQKQLLRGAGGRIPRNNVSATWNCNWEMSSRRSGLATLATFKIPKVANEPNVSRNPYEGRERKLLKSYHKDILLMEIH